MISQHMRFTAAAMIPTGDFLAHVGDWTGLPPAELLGLMRGAAPVSAGGSDELERLIAGDRQRPRGAGELLESDDDPGQGARTRCARCRARPGRPCRATSTSSATGSSTASTSREPSALELPDALLRAIRVAVAGPRRRRLGRRRARSPTCAQRCPRSTAPSSTSCSAEARLTYRLRDERGVYSDIWASGLMRRAVLAAGRRLASRGRIHDAEHLVDASVDEMCALLSGFGGTVRRRARGAVRVPRHAQRQGRAAVPRPAPAAAAGPVRAAAARRPADARDRHRAWARCSGAPRSEHEEHLLRGLAASRGVYEGPARRVSGPSEFGRIVQGDVLVTESTTEAFNILLPLLGAIVTDNGGLLSHSAIVAREYGIPGVVGTREATERIADGARVRVDGDAGEVTVLA